MNFIDKILITFILNKYKKKLERDLDIAKFTYSYVCMDTEAISERTCAVRYTREDKNVDDVITGVKTYKKY